MNEGRKEGRDFCQVGLLVFAIREKKFSSTFCVCVCVCVLSEEKRVEGKGGELNRF